MTIFDDHTSEIFEIDRCPNCGQRVFGVMHFCGTTMTPDAVVAVERVAQALRAGLEKATRCDADGSVD